MLGRGVAVPPVPMPTSEPIWSKGTAKGNSSTHCLCLPLSVEVGLEVNDSLVD